MLPDNFIYLLYYEWDSIKLKEQPVENAQWLPNGGNYPQTDEIAWVGCCKDINGWKKVYYTVETQGIEHTTCIFTLSLIHICHTIPATVKKGRRLIVMIHINKSKVRQQLLVARLLDFYGLSTHSEKIQQRKHIYQNQNTAPVKLRYYDSSNKYPTLEEYLVKKRVI